MNNGDFSSILVILIPMILIIVFNIFFKRRKTDKTQPEIAMSLLSEVAANQQIAETVLHEAQVRKFRISSWQKNREKLDFLDQKLQDELANAFGMVEEFNRAVDATHKFKSSSYLQGISVDRLKESLTRSRQGLEEWFESNKDQAMTMPGRRGCLGA